MPEVSSDVPPSPILCFPWAVRIGAALLCAFAVIVALVLYDNSLRSHLETTSETTAVGDTRYFLLTAGTALPAVVATFQGRALTLADAKPIDLRETHTQRIGSDPAAGLEIYALSAAATATERQRVGSDGVTYLLKTGVNQFVVARPGAAK